MTQSEAKEEMKGKLGELEHELDFYGECSKKHLLSLLRSLIEALPEDE